MNEELHPFAQEIANSESTKRFFEGIERAIKHDMANGMTRKESIARLIKK